MKKKLAELIDLLYGFRKFIAFMLLFVLSIIFRIVNLVDGAQFVDLIKNVAIAFFATNGIEHFTQMAKDYIASKTSPKLVDEAPKDTP